MKKYFTFCIILIAGICFYSCSDSTSSNDNYSESLIGEWRWLKTTGGIAGSVITPSSVGHNEYYIFSDSLLIIKKDDIATDTLNYTYTKDSTNLLLICYKFRETPHYGIPTIVTFIKDTVILHEDNVDGQTHFYVRN